MEDDQDKENDDDQDDNKEESSNSSDDVDISDVNNINYKRLDQMLLHQKKKGKRRFSDNSWTDEKLNGFIDLLSKEPQHRKGKGRWDAFSKELHKVGTDKKALSVANR